ncbi:MAG: hypothetical protein PVH68_12235 [Armatimonadota bacterium]|jgi:hypothetical protein
MRRSLLLSVLLLIVVSAVLVTSAAAQLRRVPSGRVLRPPTTRLEPIKPATGTVRPADVFFSTEEDFISEKATTAAGGYVSDGDLLTGTGQIFRRNKELLLVFNVAEDLGLDAADVIWVSDDARTSLIAFSTELDDPRGRFTAGDLLATNGAILPNAALLAAHRIPPRLDLGLDAVHFTGKVEGIRRFLDDVKSRGPIYWVQNPNALLELLKSANVDLWFSTEGTAPPVNRPRFLDGDLLSIKGGIIAANGVLLPASVPAGIPSRGVDFGLDAVLSDRSGKREPIVFSTSLLFQGRPAFTDGDGLRINNGVVIPHTNLISPFSPKARFLGLDALSLRR